MSILLENLDILMFVVLIGGILAGYPVTFTLAGLATIFAGIGIATGHFDTRLLGVLAQRIFGIMTNNVLIAIPLFVAMGVVLERSRIAEELLEEMSSLFGQLGGGLAVSVTIVGALLAASSGIVGATVTTMALIALPSMLRYGYSRPLAAGTVCTAGTLGQIIGAGDFSLIFRGLGGDATSEAILTNMPGGETGALVFVMVLVFVLGFVLDFVEITIILLPIVAPALILLGHDPMCRSHESGRSSRPPPGPLPGAGPAATSSISDISATATCT